MPGLAKTRADQLEFCPQLNTAHPEGWRERPCEAPATITMIMR
jgi:hypothetical protein